MAERTRRNVRVPRPPVRPPPVPSRVLRNRRGPTPPDAIVNALTAAYVADPESNTGTWISALLLAMHALNVKARREVGRSGVDVPAELPDDPDTVNWMSELSFGVGQRQGAGWTLAAILAWIANFTRAGFVKRVRYYALAGGSEGYIWSTLLDAKVRPRHVELEGTYHKWSEPPVSGSNGFRGHCGEPGGCRCFCWPLPSPRGNKSVESTGVAKLPRSD